MAQHYSTDERLSTLDPEMIIIFGQIIVEAIGLIRFCRSSSKTTRQRERVSYPYFTEAAMAHPTDEEKQALRGLIKNSLGDEYSHLTDRVFDAIIKAGSSLKPEEMESLIDSAK